jgi:hypothetical protein
MAGKFIMDGDACSFYSKSSRASTASTANKMLFMIHRFIQLTVVAAFKPTSAGLTSELRSSAITHWFSAC